MSDKNKVVFYHANCADGFGAAWAAWKALGWDADYLPMGYGGTLPEVREDADVYMLDFTVPRDVLYKFAETVRSVTVIDHHQSAWKELACFPNATFDMTKSGAVLAWEYFHGGLAVPPLLLYVQDRDLWKWKLPESEAINAAISSYDKEFEIWNALEEKVAAFVDNDYSYILDEGRTCVRLRDQMVTLQASGAREGVLNGEKMMIANATLWQSETGHWLLEKYPEIDVVGIFWDRFDGRRHWSLRSRRSGFNCAEFAKRFGGGGHQAAAAFIEEVTR